MTDQIFYEGLRAVIRDAIASHFAAYTDEELREFAAESLNLPPRPTLADMSVEERAACQWMQADVAGHDTRYVIATPDDGDGEAVLIAADGRIDWIYPSLVTPRPDLPRLEWPGTEKPAPAPATLTAGSEWGDIDALTDACRESGRDQITVIDTDGDVSVWNGIAGWWQTGTPSDGYEPYTILHTGREADQ